MNSFFKTFLACLLAIIASSLISFFFFIIFLAGLAATFSAPQPEQRVASGSVLQIDLSIPLIEKPAFNPLDNIDLSNFKVKQIITLREAVGAIGKAAIDPNIAGIFIKLPAAIPSSISSLYEIREVLRDFRVSEKFIICYGDAISQGGFYLASVADKIYLNPQGGLAWNGMASGVTFYKGTMDKLGIKAEIIRHGKFKGAVEPFMREDLSLENRLQIQSMISSIWDHIVGEIAESRSLDAVVLNDYATRLAVDTPEKAKELGLVDDLFYNDEVKAHLAYLTGSDEPKIISLLQYKNSGISISGDVLSKNKIALVYAEGAIVDSGDPNKEIVGTKLAETIASIRADSSVKALVLRINSPGGSALASDIIWREMELTRQNKPVVVSMNGVAASGGYYIGCAADRIVTAPTTITGSIGVFGLLLNVEKGAKDLLGINMDIVSTNPSASLGNIFHEVTPAERNYIQNNVDRTYARFAGLVAQGRRMEYAEVDSVGQGRVWTGLQAIDNKLADCAGTLSDAIELAAELGSVADYRIKSYPEADNSFRSVFSAMYQESLEQIFARKKNTPLASELERLEQLFDRQGVRAAMPYEIELID